MSSRHKRSSRDSRRSNFYPTRWSDWTWNEDFQRWARKREVAEGRWDWEYSEPLETQGETSQTTGVQSEETELYRQDDGVSGITQGLAETHVWTPTEQPEESQEYRSSYSQPYVESSSTYFDDSNRLTCSSCPRTFSRRADLERHIKTVHENDGVRRFECQVKGCPAKVRSWNTAAKLRLHEKNWHGGDSNPYSSYTQQPLQASSQEDPNERQETGYSSDYPQQPQSYGSDYLQQSQSYTAGYSQQSQSYSSYTAPPLVPSPARGNISTRDTNRQHDKLDKKFQVHRSKDFYFGRVFKVLWSEPVGSGGTEITPPVNSKYGEKAFHKIRRFIVVKPGNGHSICLPILTYGLQGVLKRGVHPEDHAAVYSSRNNRPYLLDAEARLPLKRPIRIDMKDVSEKLDPLSRLNYAKLYTVEHNVKVYFIGKVATRHEQHLMVDYNQVHPPLSAHDINYREHSNDNDESQFASMADHTPSYQRSPTPSGYTPSYPTPSEYTPSYPTSSGYTQSYGLSYGEGPPATASSSSRAAQDPPYYENSYDDAYDAD